MATKLSVVNQVLSDLGQEPVADLSSASLERSLAAVKVLRQLDQARDTVLRRHGWTCALDYASLSPAQIGGYANWRFPYVYLLPEGALRLWAVDDGCARGWSEGRLYGWAGGARYGPGWEAGTIDTDIGARPVVRAVSSGPLNVAFVRGVSWEALDAHVADAVAAEAAWRAARGVTGQEPSQAMMSAAQSRMMLAISVDGTQADSGSAGPSELALLRAVAS